MELHEEIQELLKKHKKTLIAVPRLHANKDGTFAIVADIRIFDVEEKKEEAKNE